MTINKEKTLASQVRDDFPILREFVNGKPLVYLDNAETSQKPQVVLNALRDCYEQYNSNVHRSIPLVTELPMIMKQHGAKLPPFLAGGKMNADVFKDHFTYKDVPKKFEAGTPAIADAIADNSLTIESGFQG